MKTKLKNLIEEAIDKTIQDNCEDDLWDGYIHNDLVLQMATAAGQVFDAAMEAQEFAKSQEF